MKTSVVGYLAAIAAFLFIPVEDVFPQRMSQLIYAEDTTFSANEVRELKLRFRNLNFFRNNEYKGNLVKGYTLPGLWILPTVSYQPLRNLQTRRHPVSHQQECEDRASWHICVCKD